MLIKMLDCRTSQIIIEEFAEDIGFQEMENVAMLKRVVFAANQENATVQDGLFGTLLNEGYFANRSIFGDDDIIVF
jgi:hypothetical protein